MELGVFSVYDSKAGAYLRPFYERNAATALRSFEEACRDTQSNFYKYAADYTLFDIGKWDEEDGEIRMNEAKYPLGNAIEFTEQPAPALEVAR